MKRAAVITIVLLLLAALIGGLAYFQFVLKPEMVRSALTAAPPPPATVSAEPAKSAAWTPFLQAIGTFRAIQGIDVAPQLDGVVAAIHFDSGQDVDAGTLLVELDDSIEQADLKANIAELKKNELDLERQRQLLSREVTPKTNYDAALAQRDVAAAAVERTKAAITKKKILAPFRGRLGLRIADLGQYVSAGTPLVPLQQLDPIYVDFPIPEHDFGKLRPGQVTEVRVDAYPDAVFRGKISSIDARVATETRAVKVRAEIENPDRRLVPGMFANVNVLVGQPQQVVTLPRTAVTYSLYGDSVYVVQPAAAPTTGQPEAAAGNDGGELIAERRFVRVGDTRDDRVAIVEGVKAGEMVVTSGQIKLQPKTRVVIDNRDAPKAPAVRPKE
jgi:membrane fusion protein (multidrug efflux system)